MGRGASPVLVKSITADFMSGACVLYVRDFGGNALPCAS